MQVGIRFNEKVIADWKKYGVKSVFFLNFIKLFSAVLCFTAIIAGLYMYINVENVKKEYTNIGITNAQKLEERLEKYINDAKKVAGNLMVDTDVKSLISGIYVLKDKANIDTGISNKIYSYKNLNNEINSVYIYSEKTKELFSEKGSVHGENVKNMEWINAVKAESERKIKIIAQQQDEVKVISAIGRCNVDGAVGYVTVNINVSAIRDEILSNYAYSRLTDNKGEVIFSTDLNEFMQKKELFDSDYSRLIDMDGKKYVECGYVIEDMDLRAVVQTPIDSYKGISNTILMGSWLLVMFIILLGGIISVIFAGYISVPVSNLNRLLNKYEKMDADTSEREIDSITRSIIKLIDDNEFLKEEIDKRMTEYKKLQLTSLQTQMNPHYLKNTLNVMSLNTIMEHGPSDRLVNMLKNLSSSLNYSINTDKVCVSIKEELDFFEYYRKIIGYSYPSVRINVFADEGVENYKILRLCIQPLAENSLLHGLKSKKYNGSIDIYIKDDGENIRLEIIDNGEGIENPDELMKKLHEDLLEESGGSKIGLKNVILRFTIFFQDKFSFDIKSENGNGTRILIIYPKLI